MLRHWPVLVAGLYFIGGLGAWAFFLSNIAEEFGAAGLQMYVLPVSLIGIAIGKVIGASSFIFVPQSLGDPAAHALFFFPSLGFLTYLVGWKFPAIYRKMMAD